MSAKHGGLVGFVFRALAGVVFLVTPRCHGITRLLSRSMDGPLPWHARWRVRLHLAFCAWCERYGKQLRSLRTFSRAFPERGCEEGEAVLPPADRERLKALLRRESDR